MVLFIFLKCSSLPDGRVGTNKSWQLGGKNNFFGLRYTLTACLPDANYFRTLRNLSKRGEKLWHYMRHWDRQSNALLFHCKLLFWCRLFQVITGSQIPMTNRSLKGQQTRSSWLLDPYSQDLIGIQAWLGIKLRFFWRKTFLLR